MMQREQYLNTVNKEAASRLSKYKNLQHCFWFFELCVRDFKHTFQWKKTLAEVRDKSLVEVPEFAALCFWVLSYAFKILNMHFVQDVI